MSAPPTVFVLAGWGSLPTGAYFVPLIAALRAAGANVIPATDACADDDIAKHVTNLARLVGSTPLTRNTFFIGQSIGNQIIARYLASLPAGTVIGGWIAIAGWFRLDRTATKARPAWVEGFYQSNWDKLAPWTDVSTLNLPHLRAACPKVLALLGTDDYLIGLDDGGKSNGEDFQRDVGATVHLREGRAHYFHLSELPKEEMSDIVTFVGLAQK